MRKVPSNFPEIQTLKLLANLFFTTANEIKQNANCQREVLSFFKAATLSEKISTILRKPPAVSFTYSRTVTIYFQHAPDEKRRF